MDPLKNEEPGQIVAESSPVGAGPARERPEADDDRPNNKALTPGGRPPGAEHGTGGLALVARRNARPVPTWVAAGSTPAESTDEKRGPTMTPEEATDQHEPTAAEAHAEHLASCSDCRSGNHGDCEEGSELLLDALENAETTLLEPLDRFDLGGES